MLKGFATISVIAVLLCSAPVTAQPGLGVTLTNSGLDEVATVAVDLINVLFNNLTLPDIHIDTHVAEPIGHITLDLTDISLKNFHIGGSTFQLSPPADVALDLTSITLDISMDYKWRKVNWPHASDHGEVTANPSGADLTFTLDFSIADGKLAVTPGATSFNAKDYDIHFDGKVSWLYNLLVSLFKGDIGKAVSKAITGELLRIVGNLNTDLQKIPTSTTIGGGKSELAINTTFTRIAASGPYFGLNNQLGFSDVDTGTVCPVRGVALPPYTPASQGSEFQLIVGDTNLACPLWAFQANGLLNGVLSPTADPSLAKVLNTNTFQDFIPPLYAKYPDTPLQIDITTTAAPNVSTTPTSGVAAGALLHLNMSAITNTSTVYACTLGLSLDIALDVFINKTGSPPAPAVALNVTELGLTFSVVSSAIGTISVAPLDGLLKLLLPVLTAAIDKTLAKFEVPLPAFITNPTVSYETGFFAITSNLTITPP